MAYGRKLTARASFPVVTGAAPRPATRTGVEFFGSFHTASVLATYGVPSTPTATAWTPNGASGGARSTVCTRPRAVDPAQLAVEIDEVQLAGHRVDVRAGDQADGEVCRSRGSCVVRAQVGERGDLAAFDGTDHPIARPDQQRSVGAHVDTARSAHSDRKRGCNGVAPRRTDRLHPVVSR